MGRVLADDMAPSIDRETLHVAMEEEKKKKNKKKNKKEKGEGQSPFPGFEAPIGLFVSTMHA